MKKEYVSLDEFRSITKLSSGDILQLLSRGLLDCKISSNNEMLVSITDINLNELLGICCEQICSSHKIEDPLVLEKIASAVTNKIDTMVDEAVELSLRWLEENEDA